MPFLALIAVPVGGAAFAYLTMLYVNTVGQLSGDERVRMVRRSRWTALATAVALLIVGIAIL